MKNKNRWIIIIIFPLLAISTVLIIWLLMQETEYQYLYSSEYQFDPLKLDEENLEFILLDNKELPNNTNIEKEFSNWSEEDFYLLVKKFYKLVLSDDLSLWNLNQINFFTNCENIGDGFHGMHSQYFKIDRDGISFNKLHRYIFVSLEDKKIKVIEEKYSVIPIWEKINLSKIVYSAADVLKSADTNGGYDRRQTTNNNCDVSVTLSPNSPKIQGWLVTYYSEESNNNGSTILFENQYSPFKGVVLPIPTK
ncbi:MAG: hypothetical protein CVU39_18070 [Chloroflexi bacterium HGW-Chloroflexi-10]|nr:MAG: hypothetical protein CVU39_18070 [Chloroflexi bacterium HGW-Chloroflexi-10]